MKKKALILTILSSMTLAAGGLAVALSANQLGFIDSAAGEKVTGSILFSRETGEFTRIDEKTSSTSARTGNGATYYMIAHSDSDVAGTSNVAHFGSGAQQDDQYITFSSDPNGSSEFEFQAITGIKITTTSSSSQTLYAYYSDDGTYGSSSYHSVSCSSNPTKTTFTNSHKYVKVTEYATYERNIVSVELFYECGGEEPVEPELDYIYVSGAKTSYAVGGQFIEPTVYGYYTDHNTRIMSGATFSGFDLSETGEQTVSVSCEGKSTSYTIHVKPHESDIIVSYSGLRVDWESQDLSGINFNSSTLPSYVEPGATVNFNVVMNEGYGFELFYPDESAEWIWQQISDPYSAQQSITFPSTGCESIEIELAYAAPVVSIYAYEPKTTYAVGSSFVAPVVVGVQSNGAESNLDPSDVSFTGFDSSAVVASQTITVTYGLIHSSYTIEIVSEIPGLNCTYKIAQSSSTDYKLQFNSDGTGKYYRWYNSTESWAIAFTYTYNSSTGAVSIELDHEVTYSKVNNFANGYRMVQANYTSGVISFVNDSGFINSSNEFEIDMVRVSSGEFSTDHRTFTLA